MTTSGPEVPAPAAPGGAAPLSAGRLWLVLGVTWLGLMFDGLEMGLYAVMVRPALKTLLPPEAQANIADYIGYTVCAFMLGAALGGVLFGRLADRIGRTRAMVLTIAVYAFFTGLTAWVNSPAQLMACRFLGALGLGGEWGVGIALLVETWPERRRPLLAGISGCAINVGFLCASFLAEWVNAPGLRWEAILPAWVIRSLPAAGADQLPWRVTFAAGLLPALLTLAVRVWVPESERWVRSRDKARAVRAVELFSPAYRRSTIMGTLLAGVALLGTWGSFLWLAYWVNQLATGTPQSATAAAVVGRYQAFGMIVGSFLGGPLAGWMGRKRSYAFLCVAAWASLMFLYGVPREFGPSMKAAASVAGVFVTAFFGWLPLYLPELYPTHLRAYGQGFCFNMGRIVTAAGVLMAGRLVTFFHEDYARGMQWMALVYFAGLAVVGFAPETKGKALPE